MSGVCGVSGVSSVSGVSRRGMREGRERRERREPAWVARGGVSGESGVSRRGWREGRERRQGHLLKLRTIKRSFQVRSAAALSNLTTPRSIIRKKYAPHSWEGWLDRVL